MLKQVSLLLRLTPNSLFQEALIDLDGSGPVTARKDDAPAAVEAAIADVVGLSSASCGGGLIQITSG